MNHEQPPSSSSRCRREFLGWKRPIEGAAFEWSKHQEFAGGASPGTPTSEWIFANARRAMRFRRLLDQATDRDAWRGRPPVISTVEDLTVRLAMSNSRGLRVATPLELEEAWVSVLCDAVEEVADVDVLLGKRRRLSSSDARWIGRQLSRSIAQLRGNQNSPANVVAISTYEAEIAQWRVIEQLEARVRHVLEGRGACTLEELLARRIESGEAGGGAYICAGITSLSGQVQAILRASDVVVLVEAPPEHVAGFDELGLLRVDYWRTWPCSVPVSQITTGVELVEEVQQVIATWRSRPDLTRIEVCLADPGLDTGPAVDQERGRTAIATRAGRAVSAIAAVVRASPKFRKVEDAPRTSMQPRTDEASDDARPLGRITALESVESAPETVAGSFFGRERELQSLRECWEAVAEGKGPRFVLVAAESGIGKSRLVQALYQQLSNDARWDPPDVDYWPPAFRRLERGNEVNPDTQSHVAHGPPRFMWLGMAFENGGRSEAIHDLERLLKAHDHVIRRSVGGWLDRRITRSAFEAAASESSLELAGSLIPGFGPMFRLGKELAAAYQTSHERPGTADEQLRNQIVDAAERVYKGLRSLLRGDDMGRLPTVLWLDDAQWIDGESAEFIYKLWQQAEQHDWPLMIVATHWEREWREQRNAPATGSGYRLADLIDRRGFVEMYLESASAPELAGYLDHRLPGLTPRQRALVIDRSGGNFLSLVESVGELRDICDEAFVGGNEMNALTRQGESIVEQWSGRREQRVAEQFKKLKPPMRRAVLAVATRLGSRFLTAVVERLACTAPELMATATGSDVRGVLDSLAQPLTILKTPADLPRFREFRDVAYFRTAQEHFHRFLSDQGGVVDTAFRDVLVEWINASFDGRGRLRERGESQASEDEFHAMVDLTDREMLAVLEAGSSLLSWPRDPDWSRPEHVAAVRAEFLMIRQWGRAELWNRIKTVERREFPRAAVAAEDVEREIGEVLRKVDARSREDAPHAEPPSTTSVSAFAAMVRHPDIARWMDPTEPASLPVRVSALIRGCACRRLGDLARVASSRVDMPLEWDGGEMGSMIEALHRFESHLSAWTGHDRPMRDWVAEVASWVETLRCDTSEHATSQGQTALAETLDDFGRRWAASEQLYSAAEAFDLITRHLRETPMPSDVDSGDVPSRPWSELDETDADAVIVAGLHDGAVPGAPEIDPCLGESLKEQLGLPTHASTVARASMLLELAFRRCSDLRVIVPATDAEGCLALPSRLLMFGGPDELTTRVLTLTSASADRPAILPAGGSQAFSPPEPDPEALLPERLEIASLRQYWTDPRRFYLRHVERLRGISEVGNGQDARHLGITDATVLASVLLKAEWKMAMQPEDLRDLLRSTLAHLVEARIGKSPSVSIRAQLGALKSRLDRFADVEAKLRDEGWWIEQVEVEIDASLEIGDGAAPQRLVGRIDRIARHVETGRLRIIDCSTGLGAAGRERSQLALRDARRRWIGLVLPLYRHLYSAQFEVPEAAIEVGCIGLSYPECSEAAFAEAIEEVRGLIRAIRERRFPRVEPCGYPDAFSNLLHEPVIGTDS